MWAGWEALVPLNLMLAASFSLVTQRRPYESIALGSLSMTLLAYPMYTLMRRRECISGERGLVKATLRPVREHARQIWSQEGVRGFYRGFAGFAFINGMMFAMGIQLQRDRMGF